MQDAPTSQDLLIAVAQYLNTELAPTLTDPRQKFRALVAANVLHIINRELKLDDAQLHAEHDRLRTVLSDSNASAETDAAAVTRLTRLLAARVRAGDADAGPFHDAVYAHVQQTVVEKLIVANPRYLERVMPATNRTNP